MPTHERRAVRAITEAEDVLDDARALGDWLERSYADGTMTAAEIMEGRVRLDRLNRNALESVIAAQWTDAGERRAWGELADGPTPRLEHYERQILRQADSIGFELGRMVEFPVERVRTNTA